MGRHWRQFSRSCRARATRRNTRSLKCSDYGLPPRRERLFIVGVHNAEASILDFSAYRRDVSLTEFMGMPFERKHAYTIRCGGRRSGIHDRHNWDTYRVDGQAHTLTLSDCLKLQGFGEDFKLCGSVSQQWQQVGNTIPTRFTEMLAMNLRALS